MTTTENNVAAQAGDSEPRERSPYVLGVKPSTWDAQIAAQAGDEPMRLVSANLLDRAVALLQSSGQMGVAHQLKECVSPRATADVERDAARFRSAIALDDNAEALYAAVMCNSDADMIRQVFDAAIATTKPGA